MGRDLQKGPSMTQQWSKAVKLPSFGFLHRDGFNAMMVACDAAAFLLVTGVLSRTSPQMIE